MQQSPCKKFVKILQILDYQIIFPPSHYPDVFLSYAKTCKGIFNKRPVRCSSILNNVKELSVLKLARIYINYIKWNRIFLFVLFWWEFWLLKVRSVREVVRVFGLGPNRSNFAWSVSSPLVSSCRLCSFDT